jgi:hypothetical protein
VADTCGAAERANLLVKLMSAGSCEGDDGAGQQAIGEGLDWGLGTQVCVVSRDSCQVVMSVIVAAGYLGRSDVGVCYSKQI